MGVVYADSFDGYTGTDPAAPTAVSLTSKYTVTGAGLSLVTGRYGGRALRVPGSNTSRAKSGAFTAAVGSFSLCMSVRVGGFDADPAFALLNAATVMLGVVFNTSGGITIERGNVALVSTANSLWVADGTTWHTLKISGVINDSTGSIVINLDGSEVLNATGLDTRNGTPTTIDNIFYNNEGVSVGQTDYDDVFITDSATAPADDYFIEAVPVNADGTPLNWTPSTGSGHFAVVDELPGSITDYLTASTVGNIDELEVGNLATAPTAIMAAQFVGHFDKTDGTARSVALGVKSGATTSAGSNVTLTTAGVRVERMFDTDPNTGVAWTQSGLQAAKIRPEVTV
jgi:hypothetical protein